MKIMYVDIAITGHRVPYLKTLVDNSENEIIVVLPEKVEGINCKQYVCEYNNKERSLKTHKLWLDSVLKCAKKENPDIVHFLSGDNFYRYFGFGLEKFKKYKVFFTFHFVKSSLLHKISIKMISILSEKMIFHTDYLRKQAASIGVKNAYHVEYPVFGGKECDNAEARDYFNLKGDIPVISCIGGTRQDKGLDILLDALKKVNVPFQLLVAGKEEHFTKEYIEENIETYKENVHLALRFLTEDELVYAMNATDIVVLPYREWFNGASGPLGEGVILNKCIIGPKHGNLGDTIKSNHLGYTFETENPDDLAEVLNNALQSAFVVDEKYREYQKTLSVSDFIKGYNDLYKAITRD